MRTLRSKTLLATARSRQRVLLLSVACCVFLALPVANTWAAAGSPPDRGLAARDRFDLVVIDAGHGGGDEGATGSGGLREKNVVLDVSKRLASRLKARQLKILLTRDDDTFVALEERTSRANDARGDLFISLHANASTSDKPRGIETYFVSLEASDSSAQNLAQRENEALRRAGANSVASDPFLALLGDMIATEHMEESNDFAKIAQAELDRLAGVPSRGVKQAPFVVLMGVQMPAALIELGFVSNSRDADMLESDAHRDRIADALTRAVISFGKRYDARRGLTAN